MKKKLSIAGIVVGVAAIIIYILMQSKTSASISIVGGADGPTSVFIAGKLNDTYTLGLLVFGVVCIGIGIACLVKSNSSSHKLKEK